MVLNQYETKTICKDLKIKGTKSIILIGSRAKGDVEKGSDYDFYIVTPTLLVPFIYKKLKNKEKILEEKLEAKVSAAPLTIRRIKNGNDLLLLKTKIEGITISGKDYIDDIKIRNVKDLPYSEIYSYLFSGLLFLLQNFVPEKEMLRKNKNKILYDLSKSIIYSSESILFSEGILPRNKREVFNLIASREDISEDFLGCVSLAQSIINGNTKTDVEESWILARNALIYAYKKLGIKYLNINSGLENIITNYLNGHEPFARKLQFSIHTGLIYKESPLRFLLTKTSIERHYHIALLYLSMSVDRELRIKKLFLDKTHDIINSLPFSVNNNYNSEDKYVWQEIKNNLLNYWPIIFAKSIIV